MTDSHVILIDRIDARLQALDGLSDRKASLNACGKPDLIRDIRRGKDVGTTRIADLARALGTTVGYLHGETDAPSPKRTRKPAGPAIPSAQDLPRDLPVYGTVMGAPSDIWADGEVAIQQVDLNTSNVIDWFRRPPALRDKREAYVLYTIGDSMDPAYEDGSAMIVDPKRRVGARDYVVVYLRGEDHDETVAVLIKRLVRKSTEYIELEQFNPRTTFRLDAKRVRAIHGVVPWGEAMGF